MRDLKADLALCLKAPAGLWSRVKPIGARYWTIGVIKDHIARPFEGDEAEAAWNLIEAAREGWPEAIRRALDAEKRVRILEHILRSRGVTPNDQAILERHLAEMGAGEEG